MSMRCPNDDVAMNPVRLQAHLGQSVTVDQCPQCGGLWFDRLELHRTKDGESDKIDATLDAVALNTPSEMHALVRHCPRDAAELARFEDRYFPKEIIVERCPKCAGFWLNRGEFTKYQAARREMKPPREIIIEGPALQDEIENAFALHGSGVAASPIVRAARFLSTPIDRATLRPSESGPGLANEETVNALMSILTTLLRLFILR